MNRDGGRVYPATILTVLLMRLTDGLRIVAASRRIDAISRMAARAAAAILLGMMLLIVLEVTLREGFSSSTRFAHEYSGYLLIAIALWATADVLAANKHIRVSVVTDRLSPRTQLQLERISYLLGLVLVVIVLQASTNLVITSIKTGMLTMGVYQIPVFLPQLAIPVGFLFLLLQMAVCTVRAFVGPEQ